MKDNYPKFEDSDAAVFFNAMKMGGGLQVTRQFVKSMQVWDKTLLQEAEKRRRQEKE